MQKEQKLILRRKLLEFIWGLEPSLEEQLNIGDRMVRNHDYTLLLTGDSQESEIAFFDSFIQVSSDQDSRPSRHIAYDEPSVA